MGPVLTQLKQNTNSWPRLAAGCCSGWCCQPGGCVCQQLVATLSDMLITHNMYAAADRTHQTNTCYMPSSSTNLRPCLCPCDAHAPVPATQMLLVALHELISIDTHRQSFPKQCTVTCTFSTNCTTPRSKHAALHTITNSNSHRPISKEGPSPTAGTAAAVLVPPQMHTNNVPLTQCTARTQQYTIPLSPCTAPCGSCSS